MNEPQQTLLKEELQAVPQFQARPDLVQLWSSRGQLFLVQYEKSGYSFESVEAGSACADVSAQFDKKLESSPHIFKSSPEAFQRRVIKSTDLLKQSSIEEEEPWHAIVQHSACFSSGKRQSQYNFSVDASKQRADEIRKIQEHFQLHQPFNSQKFHFLKTSPEEDVMEVWREGQRHLVKVNISPQFRSHTLLLPRVDEMLPQFISDSSVLEDMLFFWNNVLGAQSRFFIGYNSAGAFSSINHLHFQVFDFNEVKASVSLKNSELLYAQWLVSMANAATSEGNAISETLEGASPIELICVDTRKHFDCKLHDKLIYDCSVVFWRCTKPLEQADLKVIASKIFSDHFTGKLHASNTPYNLILLENALVIAPRKHQVEVEDEKVFGPAFLELCGCWVVKDSDLWEGGYNDQKLQAEAYCLEQLKTNVNL